MMRYINRIFT